MSLQRRHVNQQRVACPAAHVLFWAPLQGTCWKHFKDVEREARDSSWYLATCKFCAHAERLRLKTGRARAHLGCITGQNVRICGRVPPEIRDQLCQPIIIGTARLQTDYR